MHGSVSQLLVHNCDGISGNSAGDAAGGGEAGAAEDPEFADFDFDAPSDLRGFEAAAMLQLLSDPEVSGIP